MCAPRRSLFSFVFSTLLVHSHSLVLPSNISVLAASGPGSAGAAGTEVQSWALNLLSAATELSEDSSTLNPSTPGTVELNLLNLNNGTL